MSAPFAALEQRVNAAVLKRLANAVAVLDGVSVAGIFDNDYLAAAFGQHEMAAAQPMLVVASSSVPQNPVGKSVGIGPSAYTIVEHRPDGTGISRLMLERS